MKKFPYKTSKNYSILKDLLDNGINVITITRRRKRVNLAFVAYSYISDISDRTVYIIGRNESEGLITISDRDLKSHTFEELCSLYKIEFIEP